jgi:hypothetical protein
VCEKRWVRMRNEHEILFLEMEMRCEFFDVDANWFWALAGFFLVERLFVGCFCVDGIAEGSFY